MEGPPRERAALFVVKYPLASLLLGGVDMGFLLRQKALKSAVTALISSGLIALAFGMAEGVAEAGEGKVVKKAPVGARASAQGTSAGGQQSVAQQGSEPRKEFRESGEYPYVFRPVGYLATVGPAPMRLGPPMPVCSERTPPRLIEPKRPSVTLQSTKPPQQPPGPTYSSGGGAYPPGGGPGAMGQGGVDFNRPPDEVMEFFQPQALTDQQRRLLLDPSFIPAPPVRVAPLMVAPQPIQAAPPSTATYNQN
jgi:hypothetical protein